MVTQQLASEVGMAEFQERLGVLKSLQNIWCEGKKAVVNAVDRGIYVCVCMYVQSNLP